MTGLRSLGFTRLLTGMGWGSYDREILLWFGLEEGEIVVPRDLNV